MKKFFREFKEFISRGNVMDLAVGVIIGGAFSAIITALTNNILMPVINYFLKLITGGKGLSGVYTYLDKQYVVGENGAYVLNEAGEKIIDVANSIYIDWGAFISSIINFILIALVIFLLLKFIMHLKGVSKPRYGEAITADEYKQWRKEGKSKEEIAKINEARLAEKKAEEEKKAAEAAANTTEALLKDIKEILEKK